MRAYLRRPEWRLRWLAVADVFVTAKVCTRSSFRRFHRMGLTFEKLAAIRHRLDQYWISKSSRARNCLRPGIKGADARVSSP
jgi:hypothetical protein